MVLIDFLVVGAFVGVILGIGWRARRHTPDTFWVAGRRVGTRRLTASLVATVFGASSTVGIIGLGYATGLTGAWWALIGGLALIPFGLVIAGRVRRLQVYTLPDILRRAYGTRVSVAAALLIALAWCGVVAAQIVAGAVLLGAVLPLSLQPALLLVSAVFVGYTFLGGQLSVIRTDAWQLALFCGALVTMLGLVLAAGLGAGTVPAGIAAGHLAFPVSPSFGWYELLVFYPLIVGMPYLVGPDMYSRVLCARDEPTARRAALLAAAAVVPLALSLALLGLLIQAHMPGLEPESALPSAILELAPVGLRGLIVVGVLGAVMSSADTTLVSASTIFSLNVAGPSTAMSPEARLRLTRATVLVVGVIAWGMAALQQGIIASLLLAYTVFVGGVALPTLLSFWRDRLGINAAGALAAVLLGGVTAVLGALGDGELLVTLLGDALTEWLSMLLGPRFASILPLVLSLIVLLGVSRLAGGDRIGGREAPSLSGVRDVTGEAHKGG